MKKNTLLLLLIFFFCHLLKATETINVNPFEKFQKLEGWGVSISWWANDVGNKFPESSLNTFCKWLTSPDELNMNVFRYNISGGDAPGHEHMRKDAQIDGYKNNELEPYNWSNDSAQRKVLLMVHKMKPNGIYEAANYSPPYWMTKSGCSAGETSGLDNLKDDYYDDFAQYLTECVKHYKERYGITFSTISPVNEPFSNWWKSNGSQEGCAFSQHNQERIIRELYKELKSRKMLRYTGISAMDANSLDECIKGLEGYKQAGVLPMIKQINVHTYAGDKRSQVYKFASENKIPLWQSESGPLNIKLKGFDNFLFMTQRIITDMRELKPKVWCDWQYLGRGFGGVWSLVGYVDSTKTFERTKGFYCRKQITNLIKPGYTFIANDNPNTLSAISPDKKIIIIAVVNQAVDDELFNINIKDTKIKNVSCYRTSETEDFVSVNEPIRFTSTSLNFIAKRKSISSIVLKIK